MRYIKLFENFEDSYNDILIDFIDNSRFNVKIQNENIISIDISYSKKEMTSEIVNRRFVGYFDTKRISISNNNLGPIYDRLKKSEDTLDLVNRLEDVVLKLTNFTEHKVGYFTIVGNRVNIYLGQRLVDIHNI